MTMTIDIPKQIAEHLVQIAYVGKQLDRIPEKYEYDRQAVHKHINNVRVFERGDSLQILIHAKYETYNSGRTITAMVDYRIDETSDADTIIVYDLE